jgi:GxxExxY protein
MGIPFQRQVPLPIAYRGVKLDAGYRIDLLISQELVVEIKAVDALLPLHQAQLLTYLRLSGLKRGLLLNFNVTSLRQGIKRMVL